MNTFYKKVENSKFPIFLYELTRKITSTGKYYINFIAKYMKKKGFKIKYEDINSLYF